MIGVTRMDRVSNEEVKRITNVKKRVNGKGGYASIEMVWAYGENG